MPRNVTSSSRSRQYSVTLWKTFSFGVAFILTAYHGNAALEYPLSFRKDRIALLYRKIRKK